MASSSFVKPTLLETFWETFLDAESVAYYHNDATQTTSYTLPPAGSVILPPGWQPFLSPEGEAYFLLESTGETSWDLMRGFAVVPQARDPIERANDEGLYWETIIDTASGDVYYSNEASGSTSFDFPSRPFTPQEGRGGPAEGRALFPVVLPQGWYPALSADAEVYFVRTDPPETSWELPMGSSSALSSALLQQSVTTPVNKALTRAGTKRGRALMLLRGSMATWKARSDKGIMPRIISRPRLFCKLEDDSHITINPLERDVLRKVLADPTFQFLGVLPLGSDATAFGFTDVGASVISSPGISSSLWNAALDSSTGKSYYFNVETKEASWTLPPGGRVVARVVPRLSDVVQRMRLVVEAKVLAAKLRAQRNSEVAAFSRAASMRGGNTSSRGLGARANASAAAESSSSEAATSSLKPTMAGYLFKSDPKGRNFKWRWLTLHAASGVLSWYEVDPDTSKKRFNGAVEEAKGSIGVLGCTVETVSDADNSMPSPHGLVLSAAQRSMHLCAKTPEVLQAWQSYISAVARGSNTADANVDASRTASDKSSTVTTTQRSIVPPALLAPRAGFVDVSSQDGTGWDKRWAVLDPSSRLLLLFDRESCAPGSERAAVDMLSAVVLDAPPPGAPRIGSLPSFWLTVEENGVYGPAKGGKPMPATAFVCDTEASCIEWSSLLIAASDPSTMTVGGADASVSSALLPPTATLWHQQRNAGLFASLGSPAERRVLLNAAERTIVIFADVRGTRLATVLSLDTPGVRIAFCCDLFASSASAGWSNLRLEVTAPAHGSDDKLHTHVFRTRTHLDFCAWAACLAAL